MSDPLEEAKQLLREALLSEHMTMYVEGRIRAVLIKLDAAAEKIGELTADRDLWKQNAETAFRDRQHARYEREQMRVDRFNECEALREKLRDARRKGF